MRERRAPKLPSSVPPVGGCSMEGCRKPRKPGYLRCADHVENDRRSKARRKELQAAAAAIGEKICSRCGAQKPRSEFHDCEAKPDGLQSQCKSCSNNKASGPRASGAPQSCRQCEGQSWRRPRVGLCKCGESFAEERAVSAAEFADRRRYVTTG